MKILFISRAYPPVVGGIENQNWELFHWLAKISDVKKIVNTRGKIFLPVFLPYAKLIALILAPGRDAVLLGDAVLAPIGFAVKLIWRKPVVCVLHGLDLTYDNFIYQKIWVKFFLKKLDKFICVGQETVRVAKEKGLPENKIVFIPNGVDPERCLGHYTRDDLEKIIGENIAGKKIILTSGRLAKRKGVAWFLEKVIPRLGQNIIYVIAGDGPDRRNVEKIISDNKLANKVKMLGRVTDDVRNTLLNTCDLFVQPNIKVANDMEGFGISVIEAASCRLTVIASAIEGLKDAIKDNQNGFLVESGNAEAWVNKINNLLSNDEFRKSFGEKARLYVIDNYSWDKISRRYLEEIEKTLNQ